MSDHMNVLLVGCGYMGTEYCKVLKAQNYQPIVVGRGEEKAQKFRETTGIDCITGGLEKALQDMPEVPEYAIVAVQGQYLCATTLSLMERGCKYILVEKPAGLSREEITALSTTAQKHHTKMYVAYNRRFYASTAKALDMIKEDGGVLSVNFEFTEWSHIIAKLKVPDYLKEYILLANSTHVIDLAFFFAGEPRKISSYVAGGLPWHHNGSIYAGAGVTDKGVLFSYNANWESPGRWSVEVLTRRHRLYFKPMEELHVQNENSVEVKKMEIDDKLDRDFKPGLYNEVKAVLTNRDDPRLISIEEHLHMLQYYEKIAGLMGRE